MTLPVNARPCLHVSDELVTCPWRGGYYPAAKLSMQMKFLYNSKGQQQKKQKQRSLKEKMDFSVFASWASGLSQQPSDYKQ